MRTQHVGWLLGDFRRSLVRAKRVKRVDIIRSELTRTVSFHLWQLAWRPTHSNVERRACFEFRLVGNRCNHTNGVLVRSATIRRARSASSDNPGARRHCQQPAVAANLVSKLVPRYYDRYAIVNSQGMHAREQKNEECGFNQSKPFSISPSLGSAE